MSTKKFAAFDIDGTIFRSGLYREVVYELAKRGKIPDNFLTMLEPLENEWRARRHEGAFRQYEHTLALSFDKEVKTLKVSDFEDACQAVIEKHGDKCYRYTRDLVSSLKQSGYYLIAISGSQEELVQPFAEKYGFDAWVGQKYERNGAYFTGNITKTHEGKDKILQKIVDEESLTLAGSIAVGDSGGDTEMLAMVENPIAFNPDAFLFETARQNGWKIVVERKNVIYELESNGNSFVLA
jgi:HAD superfamily hydrolase (TIGR01490 family)